MQFSLTSKELASRVENNPSERAVTENQVLPKPPRAFQVGLKTSLLIKIIACELIRKS